MEGPDYGLWVLVGLNTAVFVAFAFSFTRPRSARDWRSFGAFAGFVLALFTEMYGFPLTIYLLSGWLATRYPGIDLFSHDAGHLMHTLLGLSGDPHADPFHVVSYLLLLGGFGLLASAWPVLHRAQREGTVAATGAYAWVRHPQYVALILILLGFLFQWPTLLTVLMFPALAVMYIRLARIEERESEQRFGAVYGDYLNRTPAFLPVPWNRKKSPLVQPERP